MCPKSSQNLTKTAFIPKSLNCAVDGPRGMNNDSFVFTNCSGRFSPLNPLSLKVKNRNSLVEFWEKVLATSGYTDYAKNDGKPGRKLCSVNYFIDVAFF